MSKDNTLTHLAIIMDGNGRWAKLQNKTRNFGHEEGAKCVRKITTYVAEKTDIKYLTLYAFSTENWKRPKLEVSSLMKLLERYIKNEKATFLQNGIRFRFIGDISAFSSSLKKELVECEKETSHCKNLTQVLALNYGSQDEITRAVNELKGSENITKEQISSKLDTSFMGDVDLLIRTGGEMRLSNFLLWQSAYAELRFTKTLWPDFTTNELEKIIQTYKTTHRRFGAI